MSATRPRMFGQELEVGIEVRNPAFGLEVGGIVNEPVWRPLSLLLPPLLFLLQNRPGGRPRRRTCPASKRVAVLPMGT